MKNPIPRRYLTLTHLEDALVRVSKTDHKSSFELHWHDYFEIEVIISGNGWQVLNGERYEIKKGQVALLTPTDFHEFITETGYRQYNIRIKESIIPEPVLDRLLEINGNIMCYFEDEDFRKIVYLAELLYMEKDFGDEKYACNLTECMISLILKNLTGSASFVQKSSKLLVHKALMYMRMHFREKISLDEIAAYINLNPSYFCRFFTSEIGMSPKKYLVKLRLEYAKKLLVTTSLSVTEICFGCGYTSLSNFLKAFKLEFNQTPKELRENEQKNNGI